MRAPLTCLTVLCAALLGSSQAQLSFELRGVSFPEPLVWPVCSLQDGVLRSVRADETVFEKKLSPEEVEQLTGIIGSQPPERWAGLYWDHHVLDGARIHFCARTSEGELEFEGLNGCPPGFRRFAAAVNAIAGKTIVPVPPAECETDSRQFKSFADAIEILKEEHER